MSNTKNFWDKQAKIYDKSEERYHQIHFKIVENTKKHIHTNDVVLDYGCGTGTKTLLLADKVKGINAIDISSKMIKEAKRKAMNRKILNVEFEDISIMDTRFEKESFDVILAFNVLHVIENNHQVIPRINQLLKQGGLFISATPCLKEKMKFINKMQLFLYGIVMKLGIIPNFLTKFKFSELEKLISSKDFRIVETEKLYQKVSNNFIVAKKVVS